MNRTFDERLELRLQEYEFAVPGRRPPPAPATDPRTVPASRPTVGGSRSRWWKPAGWKSGSHATPSCNNGRVIRKQATGCSSMPVEE